MKSCFPDVVVLTYDAKEAGTLGFSENRKIDGNENTVTIID